MKYDEFLEICENSPEYLQYGGMHVGWSLEYRVHVQLMTELLESMEKSGIIEAKDWKQKVALE